MGSTTALLADQPSKTGWLVAVGAFLLACLALPNLSTSVWPPKAAVLLIMGAAGVPLLIARAAGRGRSDRGATETWAARAAIAFIAAATVSTVGATRPVLATVGLYDQGTGLIFIVALAGCWAIGTGLRYLDRELLISALVGGAVLNAAVAILQQTIGLSRIGLFGYQGLPSGLQGNPVFMGELLAASLALLGERFIKDVRRSWVPTLVISLGIGVGSERLPAIFAVLIVLAELLLVARRRWLSRSGRVDTALPGGATGAAGGFAGLVLGGILSGSTLSRLLNGVGVVTHAATSTTAETFGQRLSAWSAALHAIAHKPLFGYGPGQFREATSSFFTMASEKNLVGTFTDAHNFIVEYATTTGLIGVALLIAWIVLAVYGRRGRLLWFSGIILVSTFAEPLNVATTPLAFLALGAAAYESFKLHPIADGKKRWTVALSDRIWAKFGTTKESEQKEPAPHASTLLRTAIFLMAVLAVFPAATLLVGDAALGRAYSEYQVAQNSAAIESATTANELLSPWPNAPLQFAQIYNYQALGGVRDAGVKEIHWNEVAVSRDPTDFATLTSLATSEYQNGRNAQAIADAKRALKYAPWYTPAMNILGYVYLATGQSSRGRMWLERSLKIQPGQRAIELELRGKCLPPRSSTGVRRVAKPALPCF
ncbi:MAG: O-antigen ligase family protein [Acidimicrobiales bacterium]